MKREDINRLKVCSKNPVKFALNALEFLVNAEECENLTVYGEGKGKKALAENKRKALRGEIFSIQYFQNECKTEEERVHLWTHVIVPKMNNKIRGIRNGKYRQNNLK